MILPSLLRRPFASVGAGAGAEEEEVEKGELDEQIKEQDNE